MAMTPNFDYPNTYDEELAKKGFKARLGLLAIATIAFVGPLTALGSEPAKANWRDFNQWYDVAADFFESSAVCQYKRDDGAEKCKAGWRASAASQRCYVRLPIEKRKADGSLPNLCDKYEGELVTIDKYEINQEVFEVCGDYQPCFIGLERDKVTQKWQWMDEPGAAAEYTNWAKDEPNNANGRERYAVIGISRAADKAAKFFHGIILATILSSVVAGCVCALVCFAIWYQGIKTKDNCCMQCSICCDATGSCCECVAFASGIGGLVTGFTFMTLWSTVMSAAASTFFIISLWATYTLYSNISRQRMNASAMPSVIGTPVMSSIK